MQYGATVDITTDIKSELIRAGVITDPASPKGVLLSKAARLFRTQGYERTTVRDIGREVGILPGSIFHHFRSKDEILRTVMRESILINLARMRQALEQESTLNGRLRALIGWELYATNGETGEAWTVLVREWRSLSSEGQSEILTLRQEYEELWLAVLTEAHSQGLVALDPAILRRLLAGALNWTSNWFRPGRGLSLDELGEEVLRLVLRDGSVASGVDASKEAP
jgi:AcrR family transcriptional regulator